MATSACRFCLSGQSGSTFHLSVVGQSPARWQRDDQLPAVPALDPVHLVLRRIHAGETTELAHVRDWQGRTSLG